MNQLTYAENLDYWLGNKTNFLYTIVLSENTIKVVKTNEDMNISSEWRIYSKEVKKEEIKLILITYNHLKWDVSEVYGLI